MLAILSLIGYIKLNKSYIFVGSLMLNGYLGKLDNPYKLIKSSIDLGVRKMIIAYKKDIYNIYTDKLNLLLAKNLFDLVDYFRGTKKLISPTELDIKADDPIKPDINDIVGQEKLIKALILSIVGRHHILIEGASGSGKTFAVKAIESVIPREIGRAHV